MRDVPARPLEQLIQAGIAPRRARRILREFAEHRADLLAEQRDLGSSEAAAVVATNTRLGSEQQLVANLLRRPELRSWTRRRPAVAFALVPLLSLVVAFITSLWGLTALVAWRKASGDTLTRASAVIHIINEYAGVYLLWVLPLATAAAFGLLAARRRETSRWPWAGILATCFIGALTNFSFSLPPMAEAPSMGAGIGIGADNMGSVLIRAGSTALLALIPYLWLRHLQRRESDGSSE